MRLCSRLGIGVLVVLLVALFLSLNELRLRADERALYMAQSVLDARLHEIRGDEKELSAALSRLSLVAQETLEDLRSEGATWDR